MATFARWLTQSTPLTASGLFKRGKDKMVKFEDFHGFKSGTFPSNSGDKNRATTDMNTWIESNTVEIISIETIMQGEGNYFKCIRLWYREIR